MSTTGEKTGRVLAVYHIGLNLTAVMLVVRGVTQVMGTNLSRSADAAISGMAGIGHILLGVSLVFYKNNCAVFQQHNIRTSRKAPDIFPITKALRNQMFSNEFFGAGVYAPNVGHVHTANFF